jgi:hypothetical protein
VSYLLGAMLLLFGGVGLGFALARWRRRAAVGVGLLVIAGIGGAMLILLIPREQFSTVCRILHRLWADDEHPYELVGAWVGWDTRYTNPYCRLELEEDGTGRCAFWYGTSFGGYSEPKPTKLWRVTRWRCSRDRIEIWLESKEGEERMRGDVYSDLLLLEYFGGDPEPDKNWFGPLHLVPADAEDAARRDVAAALEER